MKRVGPLPLSVRQPERLRCVAGGVEVGRDERGHAGGYLPVSLGRGVLVAHRGVDRRVTEAGLQLAQARARLGCEGGPGVAQVVPPQVMSPDVGAGLPEVARALAGVQWPTVLGREDQGIRPGAGVSGHVAGEQIDHGGGQMHGAQARGRLGWPEP